MTLTVSATFCREPILVGLRPPRSRKRTYGAITKSRALASDPARNVAKRVIDVTGAGLALLFFAPLFVAIAIAIKAGSPGPVFFRQRRYGQRNRLFRIYKFRTMYAHLNDPTGVRQTACNDARVTPLGRFLRQTSFDELPQLINVIKGDMSLVGPRPHVPGMLAGGLVYEDLVPYYFQRHMVRPGITGLAQVSGCRGSTAQANAAIARIDHDLDYIEKWSVTLDVKIIARTVVTEFLLGNGM
jgi:lipopolysaccharide/colanic/teichoic acid biosynthesis glycosyltransferase